MSDFIRIALLFGAGLAFVPASNAAEWGFSFYGGWNGSFNSDVRFTGPNTDWTVHDVPWVGIPFQTPGPYYGGRVSVWPARTPGWGFALDYTHAKVRAVGTAMVDTTGTINGAPGPGAGEVGDFLDVLEFTDGLNLITVNVLRDLPRIGAIRPYVGVGVGISIPHVEVTGNGGTVPFPRTFYYHFGGPAAQAFIGARVDLGPHLSVFAEAKVSWAAVSAPISGGYRIHTTIVTGHLVAGITFALGR